MAQPPASSSSNDDGRVVPFVVGNTYSKVPLSEARLDRSGRHRKIHDWTLFVDVLLSESNSRPNVIERVSFDLGPTFVPSIFYCSSPILITRNNGQQKAWRFSTRQQTYGSIAAQIAIRGTGGSVHQTSHVIQLHDERARKKPVVEMFHEHKRLRPLRMLKLAETQNFGMELELTSALHVSPETVATHLRQGGGGGRRQQQQQHVQVISNYQEGRSTVPCWKIVPDSSIVCSTSQPDCHKFELVSPVLRGGHGLSQVSTMLRALASIEPKLRVNKSMGFHVHIDVSALSLSQLIKVCQNFVKYEDVMDTFMPLSRRNASPECNRYFQSNKASVVGDTNRQRHAALASCATVPALVDMMNPSGRYYKLNLQNLATGRQPTMEFRQHSATLNYDKVSAWIRFCVALVRNSARLQSPSPFAESRDVEYQFEALFDYVIKDRAMRDFYRARREQLQGAEEQEVPCCSGCASGGTCMADK